MSAEATVAATRVPLAPMLRLGRILWRVVPWFGAAAIVVLTALALDASAGLQRQALVVAASLAVYAILVALVTELLSPARASLRVFPLSDRRAERLAFGARVLLFFLLITELGAWLVRENDWRPSIAALLHLLRNVVLVLVATGALSWSGALRAMRESSRNTLLGAIVRVVARWIVPLAVATALFLVIARGLGYVPLADFVLMGALGTAVKLVVAATLFRYVRRSMRRALSFLKGEDETEGTGAPDQTDSAALGIEIIAVGLFKWVMVLATALWILAGWGQSPEELIGGLGTPMLGESGATWGHVLGGFADVAVVLLIGWLLKNVLVFFLFPRSAIDVGARYAILAMLRYTVIAFALVFGMAALGVKTGSLGWFFGAAGIAVGMGLRDIIGNFFGSLIVLMQRPIRVGDLITVGEASGTVEDIHMRGTTLRTPDNTTVLIPNRQLLSLRIQNMTHAMAHTRIRLDVGVSYDSDPDLVKRIMLETARAHELVLDEPEPSVVFQGYGMSSLDFSLFCFTRELRRRAGIASEIRYALFSRFQREGVEIPFPQQVVHHKGAVPPTGSKQ